jgi:hypothetical protein
MKPNGHIIYNHSKGIGTSKIWQNALGCHPMFLCQEIIVMTWI